MTSGTPHAGYAVPGRQAIPRAPRSRGGVASGSGRNRRRLDPVAWLLYLLPLVAVLLEEGNLLTWLLGSLSGWVSKFLRLALWGWAAFVFARRLAARRRWPTTTACLYALAIAIPVTYLLTGSSPRYILSESTFIPLAVVALSAGARPEHRRALLIGLYVTVILHLWFIFLPPESFVRQKALVVLVQKSYAAGFLGDEQAGGKLTGLYLYPSFSGAVCIIGFSLFRFSRLLPWIKFPLMVGCALGCLLTVTRSVYLGLAAGVLLPFLFGPGRLRRISLRAVARVIISGILLIAAGVTAWYMMPEDLRAGVQHRFTGDNLAKGTQQRLHSSYGVIDGLEALFVSPLWGSSVPDSVQCLGARGQELAPHNAVVYVGVKHGFPAMLLFGAAIGLALHGLVRLNKLESATPPEKTFVSLLCGFIGCLPILFLNPNYGPLLFWVTAGVGLSYGDYRPALSGAQKRPLGGAFRAWTVRRPILGTAAKIPRTLPLGRPVQGQCGLRASRSS